MHRGFTILGLHVRISALLQEEVYRFVITDVARFVKRCFTREVRRVGIGGVVKEELGQREVVVLNREVQESVTRLRLRLRDEVWSRFEETELRREVLRKEGEEGDVVFGGTLRGGH